MNARIEGSPSFSYLVVELESGESVIGESDAMSSMSADLDMEATFNGGFFQAILKRYLGGESLFINVFRNRTEKKQEVRLVQGTPGDMKAVELDGNSICLQPGAYIASTEGIQLGVKWAGLASFFAKEGLFKLEASGKGTVWYGAYGALIEKEVKGEYIVDTAHLVAYDPQLQLKLQLAGGLFSSFFGGEGVVTKVEGNGKVVIQSRSLSGLVGWLGPRL